ncbi:MAG: hypothetical protein MUC48_00480 [Leptolyngbya sp. Prado105]|jgi:hypothetical protein|nr:hypothetical protein [Leptolyngbya sp. Prado105]
MSESNEWLNVFKGILLVTGLNIAAVILFFLLSALFAGIASMVSGMFPPLNVLMLMGIAGIGLSQFLYLIPILVILFRNQRFAVMKGVAIGAAITALLNAGCFIWFNSQFS